MISKMDSDAEIIRKCRIKEVLEIESVKTSAPGIPYTRDGNTIGQVLEKHMDKIATFVARRLRLLCFEDCRGKAAQQLVQEGWCDVIKCFIKDEPHKLAKIESGRFRLIALKSLVDVTLERIIGRTQNKKEIRNWRECPSKPGMGLSDDSMSALHAAVSEQQKEGTVHSTDAGGWDWSVQGFEFDGDAYRRKLLYGVEDGSPLATALDNWAWIASMKVYAFSDGTMVAQTERGVLPSGMYFTSSTNSGIRVIESVYVGALWVHAMGDDANERHPEGVSPEEVCRLYDEYFGTRMELLPTAPGCFEFCSTAWDGSPYGVPARPGKMLFNFLSNHNAADVASRYEQLIYELRHHPKKALYCSLALEHKVRLCANVGV